MLRRKYKYEKQYLKIDLTQTNFDYEGEDKFNIGIDIDEEVNGSPQNFSPTKTCDIEDIPENLYKSAV